MNPPECFLHVAYDIYFSGWIVLMLRFSIYPFSSAFSGPKREKYVNFWFRNADFLDKYFFCARWDMYLDVFPMVSSELNSNSHFKVLFLPTNKRFQLIHTYIFVLLIFILHSFEIPTYKMDIPWIIIIWDIEKLIYSLPKAVGPDW